MTEHNNPADTLRAELANALHDDRCGCDSWDGVNCEDYYHSEFPRSADAVLAVVRPALERQAAEVARLTRELAEAQAEVDAVTAERDKLANDLGDLSVIHSVVTENEDNLRGAGHWIAGLFNRDPEDHQIAEVLREVAEELIAWRTDSTQVPDGWRSLVRKGWSVGARPAIPADAADLAWSACMDDDKFTGLAGDQILEVIRRTLTAVAPVPVSGSDTTEDGGDRG